MRVVAGARGSKLSRVQLKEVEDELKSKISSISFSPIFVETTGDLDRKTSLRDLERSNFFTKELDEMLLEGKIDLAIHSAKDLPEPLLKGLKLVYLTKGVDPRDSLVLKENFSINTLPQKSLIASSSLRREEAVKKLRPDLRFTDIRGKIEERLQVLAEGKVDGVVIAEAALIRLKLTHLNREILSCDTAPLQGRLAVVAREDHPTILKLFDSLTPVTQPCFKPL